MEVLILNVKKKWTYPRGQELEKETLKSASRFYFFIALKTCDSSNPEAWKSVWVGEIQLLKPHCCLLRCPLGGCWESKVELRLYLSTLHTMAASQTGS